MIDLESIKKESEVTQELFACLTAGTMPISEFRARSQVPGIKEEKIALFYPPSKQRCTGPELLGRTLGISFEVSAE